MTCTNWSKLGVNWIAGGKDCHLLIVPTSMTSFLQNAHGIGLKISLKKFFKYKLTPANIA